VDLLADENQHPIVVARLREAGFRVVRGTSPGAKDSEILRRADIGSFVLVTDDRDFGDLIFNRGYPAPRAILYSRLRRIEPDGIAGRLITRLGLAGLNGCMITLTQDGERVRPFPLGAQNV
jgi:predicted nuclease of predicted toxin-antitoxin system